MWITPKPFLPTILFFSRYFMVSLTPLDIMLEVKPKNIVQLSIGRSSGSAWLVAASSVVGTGSSFFWI